MLRVAGWLYGKIADIRNSLYDRDMFQSHDLGVKTISVGNITTGGTGKTPLVAYVAGMLADAGEKVCILTRGYGRAAPRSRVLVSDGIQVLVDARMGGDEPVELARKLIGKAVVISDPDRVAAAAWAKDKFAVTAFVLDDGFQHRRVKRDLDIVCIDATDPCGGGRVLPAGRLREPFANLSRANAIVITRTDLVDSLDETITRVRKRNPDAPLFKSEMRITSVTRVDRNEQIGLGTLSGPKGTLRLLAFCGLGNPESFFRQLRSWLASIDGQCELAEARAFPDHHSYTQAEIAEIEQQARAAGAGYLITTSKDGVKLGGLEFGLPCLVTGIEVSIDDPQRFRDLVLSS